MSVLRNAPGERTRRAPARAALAAAMLAFAGLAIVPAAVHAQLVRSWRVSEHARRLEGPESPHVAWASPLRSGPIRVLAVSDLRSSRWLVELQERLETECDYAYTHGNVLVAEQGSIFTSGGGRRQTEDEELRRYLRHFSYDVAVVQSREMLAALPADIRESLFRRVREGMGLAVLRSSGAAAVPGVAVDAAPPAALSLLPLAAPPAGRPADGGPISTGVLDRGRVALCRASSIDIDALPRILLWAARREPPVAVASLDPAEPPSAAGAPGEFVVVLENRSGARAAIGVALVVTDATDGETTESRARVSLGAGETRPVRMRSSGSLAHGAYTVGAIVRDGEGRVMDYALRAHAVGGGPFIRDLLPECPPLPGAPVRVPAVVVHAGAGAAGASLDFFLRDTWGRILARRSLAIPLREGENTAEAVFDRPETKSQALGVEAVLRVGAAAVARRIAWVPVVREPRVDDLRIEGYLLRAVDPTLCRVLRAAGMDAGGLYASSPAQFLELKKCGFDVVANFTGGVPPGTGPPSRVRDGIPDEWPDARENDPYNVRIWEGRPSCPQAGGFTWGAAAFSGERARNAAACGPLSCDLCDEFTFQHDIYNKSAGKPWDDWCFCPATLNAFRARLREAWAGLAELNTQWGTAFARWEDVVPLTARKARLRSNIGPWLDFRIFLARDVAAALAGAQRQLAALSPGTRGSANIHWEGPFSAFMAYYLFGPGGLGAADCYPRTFDQVRSHGRDPAFRRIALGYTAWGETRETFDYWAWRNLVHGGGRIAVYNAQELLYESSVATPAYGPGRLAEWVESLDAGMRKTGIARAILSAEPEDVDVAILDSYRSRFASYLEPERYDSQGWFRSSLMEAYQGSIAPWKTYARLLDDLGAGWRLVADEEIESAGDLSRFKAVILPRATCLSPESLGRLERFADAGGLVVADWRCAERDGHGRPYPDDRHLARLFGIRRTGLSMDGRKGSFTVVGGPDPAAGWTGRETGVEVSGGSALGRHADGAPAVVAMQRGAGRAVYLNCAPDYAQESGGGLRALFSRLLGQAGWAPAVRIEDAQGNAVPGVLRLSRRRGVLRYVSVLKEPGGAAPETVRLVLRDGAYVYRMGTGRCFGKTERLDLPAEPAGAAVYALAPYLVEGMAVSCPPSVVRGGVLRYDITLKGSAPLGDHAVRVEVLDPAGRECPWWTGNEIAAGGVFSGSLPIALNETPGRWRIRVKDSVSGTRAETAFEVSAREVGGAKAAPTGRT